MKQQDQLPWECAYNHLPEWMEDYSVELSAVISKEDHKREIGLLDRYNELTEKENNRDTDPTELYGIEAEKDDLIAQMIKISEPYKKEAEDLRNKLNHLNN